MAKDKRKILVISEDNFLMTISIRYGKIKIKKLFDYDYKSHRGCSFSPPINNRYVYMVGGSSLEVYLYDLQDDVRDCVLRPAPPMCFQTWQPALILLGSKLFAFSIGDGFYAKPKCQFLETESEPLQWRLLQTSPCLPVPLPEDVTGYSVVSYAVNITTNDMFLSLGSSAASFAYCYNDTREQWSKFSKKPLPFVRQGKFIGSICFAFPRTYGRTDHSWYLSAYNLTIDWDDSDSDSDAVVNCVELNRYSLVENYPDPYIPANMYSIFPTTTTDENQLVIVRGTKERRYEWSKILTLEVNTVRLQNDHLAIPISLRLNPNPPLVPPLFPFPPPPPPPRPPRNSGEPESDSDPELEPDIPLFSTQVVKQKSKRLSYAIREILGEFYE